MTQSQEFKNLLYGLVKQAKKDIERRFIEAKITITPFEFGILSIIKNSPTTLAEVAKKLGVRAPSALPYVDTLQKMGFLARHSDNKDRRKLMLTVTNKGQKIILNISKTHPKDILNQAFHKLSKSKQAQLIKLLSELTQTITNNE